MEWDKMENNYQDYTDSLNTIHKENETLSDVSGFQIAGLVLGIVAIISCCCGGIVSIIAGILGVVFALIGNQKNGWNGIGIAGMICSIIGFLLGLVSFVTLVLYTYMIMK